MNIKQAADKFNFGVSSTAPLATVFALSRLPSTEYQTGWKIVYCWTDY